MFDFLKKKKKIDTNEVKAFDSAVKAIEVFIALSEWGNAKKAIEEILYKETEALNKFLEKYESENITLDAKKLIEKERKEYKRKEKIIANLKTNVDKLENKYIKKEEGERFKVRFEKIKNEIDSLIGTKNPLAAMNLLQKFLEENKENSIVINFYNREKSKVQKHIEKQRKIEQERLKKNAKTEAMELIGETVKIEKNDNDDIDDDIGIFKKISKKLNFYKTLKERIKRKKLLDEINILIEEDTRINNELAEKKLENIHRGLVKEINKHKIIGYDLYGKILGADKISGDTFGLEESNKKYNFFLGDATGHGIRAGFIITLINKLFKENYNNELNEIAFNINNGLKQDLKSRNFVTGILFEINKENSNIGFVGMGHEPIFIYRKKENKVEKIIPGGLAAGIRLIKDINDIKIKNIVLNDGDILITYSDGIIENKSIDGEYYGLEKLEKSFKMVAEYETDIKNIYDYIINDVKLFRGGSNFDDDVSMIILKRDLNKDIIKEDDKFIDELKIKEGLDRTDIKNLRGKNKEEIEKELENIRRKKETVRIIKNLENLYYTGEILKLKEEATRFIKEGYIDPKINSYLRKAIDNEKSYRVEQKNQKMQIKYSILSELYKKGDYSTVIKEIEEIISKDGNI
ncbi:MAG: PP2C family protein-serine/threonine phosphatase [Candidatus Gracilibacteria bacterium]|nr:PP2C family protein-serine/threonine phosphatase [Candidatus Gracilibacteria bacterium]